jgi:hypothetical protein
MLVTAFGGGGALLAFEVAWRTERAYPRYVADAEVGEVRINPSYYTEEIDDLIRGLPGVERVTSSDLLFAFPGYSGPPMRYSEAAARSAFVGVFGSADGRHVVMDRLAYSVGGPPNGADQVVVDRTAADTYGLAVGDVVPVSFWDVRAEMLWWTGEDPVMERLGLDELTVAGIATFPDKVLGDDLYQTGFMVVGPDVAARYSCEAFEPTAAEVAAEGAAAGVVPGCATLYRYWSALVEGGTAGAAVVQEAFVREAADRNAALPAEFPARYLLITSSIQRDLRDVARSIQPTVAAFRVLGFAGAAITLVAVGVLAERFLRRSAEERATWRHLGASRPLLTFLDGVPLTMSAIAGATLGGVGTWVGSVLGPVGQVRAIALPTGRGIESETVVALAVGLVLLGTVVTGLAWRAAGADVRAERPRSVLVARALAATSGLPALSQGLGGALARRRDAGLTAALGVVAVATLGAALTFGTSLNGLLSTPSWYGWPWDGAAMMGSGYSSQTDLDSVADRFDQIDSIESWTALGFWQSVLVDDTVVPTMIGFGRPSNLDLTLAEGRVPAEPDEIALGTHFAEARGIGIGDTVSVSGELVAIDEATVTGLVIFPSLGPLESDHTSPGDGALLRDAAFGFDDSFYRPLSFVGFTVAHDADARDVLDVVVPDLERWDGQNALRVLDAPLRPPSINSVDEIRTVPLAIAIGTAIAAAIGLNAAVLTSVGARRRDIGVLRSVGFAERQVARMVAVQSLTTTAIAVVVGLPVGVAIGRLAWVRYADEIGVITEPTVSYTVLALVVVGATVAALVAAVMPARRLARATPAELLRAE